MGLYEGGNTAVLEQKEKCRNDVETVRKFTYLGDSVSTG